MDDFTKQEIGIAKKIVGDKDMLNLLQKIFANKSSSITIADTKEKTDEELGQVVRADAIAEVKILARFGQLVRLGSETPDGKGGKPLD